MSEDWDSDVAEWAACDPETADDTIMVYGPVVARMARELLAARAAHATRPSEELVGFLYTLIRDDLVAGRVEKLVMDGEAHPPPYEFSNSHLEAYARELAARLLD